MSRHGGGGFLHACDFEPRAETTFRDAVNQGALTKGLGFRGLGFRVLPIHSLRASSLLSLAIMLRGGSLLSLPMLL